MINYTPQEKEIKPQALDFYKHLQLNKSENEKFHCRDKNLQEFNEQKAKKQKPELSEVHLGIKPMGIMLHSLGAYNMIDAGDFACDHSYLKHYISPDDSMESLGKSSVSKTWNDSTVKQCAHAAIGRVNKDKVAVYQTLPWHYRGKYCRLTEKELEKKYDGDENHISIELCHADNDLPAYFQKVYDYAANLCACICEIYKIPVQNIISRQEGLAKNLVDDNPHDNNRLDHWLINHGKSMDDLREYVQVLIDGAKKSYYRILIGNRCLFKAHAEFLVNTLQNNGFPEARVESQRRFYRNFILQRNMFDDDSDLKNAYYKKISESFEKTLNKLKRRPPMTHAFINEKIKPLEDLENLKNLGYKESCLVLTKTEDGQDNYELFTGVSLEKDKISSYLKKCPIKKKISSKRFPSENYNDQSEIYRVSLGRTYTNKKRALEDLAKIKNLPFVISLPNTEDDKGDTGTINDKNLDSSGLQVIKNEFFIEPPLNKEGEDEGQEKEKAMIIGAKTFEDAFVVEFGSNSNYFYETFLRHNPSFKKKNNFFGNGLRGIMLHSTGVVSENIGTFVGPNDGLNKDPSDYNAWNVEGKGVSCHAIIGQHLNGNFATYQLLPWDIKGGHCGIWAYDKYETLKNKLKELQKEERDTTEEEKKVNKEMAEMEKEIPECNFPKSFYSGRSGNKYYIAIEHCEDALFGRDHFEEIYKRSVRLCTYLCLAYCMDSKDIICHEEGHHLFRASNHSDVLHWFPIHGQTMDSLRADVRELIDAYLEVTGEIKLAENLASKIIYRSDDEKDIEKEKKESSYRITSVKSYENFQNDYNYTELIEARRKNIRSAYMKEFYDTHKKKNVYRVVFGEIYHDLNFSANIYKLLRTTLNDEPHCTPVFNISKPHEIMNRILEEKVLLREAKKTFWR